MKRELKILAALSTVFVVAYFLPLSNPKIQDAILDAFRLLQRCARKHVLLCLMPALSLLSMLVFCSIMRTQKMVLYVTLVIIMATITGTFWGAI